MDNFMNRYTCRELARVANTENRTIKNRSFCGRTVFSLSDNRLYSIKCKRRRISSIVLSSYSIDPLYARHAIYTDYDKNIFVKSCIHFEDGEHVNNKLSMTPKQVRAISNIRMVSI